MRLAVRSALGESVSNPLALVACSGGADSLALAAAAAFTAPRQGWRVGLVTVDHGLQEGSSSRALGLAEWASANGFEVAHAVRVQVGTNGGPEAAARDARYAALAEIATSLRAQSVLIGHTEDDQAETVLLALARGSGPRGLSGMPARMTRHGVQFVRPLLTVSRNTCRDACAAQGLTPWEDPHNTDPSYARARVRSHALPALVEALGPDVVPNLARTARLLAADNDYLDTQAGLALDHCASDGGLSTERLTLLEPALRTRVLHAWARSLGVPGAALSHRHIAALEALVTGWHGQGPTMLPGGITVARSSGTLHPT